jgi:hypothetical protein
MATALALGAAFSLTGVSEAAKGPDAEEVAVGTVAVVLASMAFLSLLYGVKRAFGGGGMPPPEESFESSEHH